MDSGKERQGLGPSAISTAAAWMERIDELSQAERHEMRQWLQGSKENARAFAAVRKAMCDVALLDACDACDESVKKPLFQTIFSRLRAMVLLSRSRRTAPLWLAGGCAVALCFFLLLPQKNPTDTVTAITPPQEFSTVVRERATYRLSDASKISLNADSHIQVRYSKHARDLMLDRGEAVFTVAKDASRPFHVATQSATVTAVGTVFGVDLVERAVEVRVFEGTVKIALPDNRVVVLTHGHWLFSDPSKGVKTGQFSPDGYRGWQNDWLDAENMPLSYAVAKLNRYTDKKIVIADTSLENVSLNGRFRLSDTDATVSMIAAGLDVCAIHQGHRIFLRRTSDINACR